MKKVITRAILCMVVSLQVCASPPGTVVILPGETYPGATPGERLAFAAQMDDMVAVGYLVSRGANVNALSPAIHGSDRYTALQYAVMQGNVRMVRYLLEHGARADIKPVVTNPDNYKTAKELAEEKGNRTIINLINRSLRRSR